MRILLVVLAVVALKYSGGQTHFRQNHWENPVMTERQRHPQEISTRNRQHKPYKFRYRVDDEVGNMHYHGQQKSGSGVVRGCYGYTDIKGLYRVVEYIADEGGFRVKIHSNEPGIHRRNPANVEMGVHSPITGIGYSYVHPCVELGTTPGYQEVRPTPKDEYPPDRETTPGYEEVWPPPEEVYPTDEETPPEYEEVWPPPEDEYPPDKETPPEYEDVWPPPEDEYPPDKETTPGYEDVWPPPEEEYPPDEETIPGHEEVWPPPENEYPDERDESTTTIKPGGGGVAPTFIGIDETPKKDPDGGPKGEDPSDEIREIPCYCAVGGNEVKDAVDRGMRLREIKTIKTRDINVAAVDRPQEPAEAIRREIILEGDCNCEFVYTETHDDGVQGIGGLTRDEMKKK